MIIRNLFRLRNAATNMSPEDFLAGVEVWDGGEVSGQVVTAETSRNVATAYRCINMLSDDVAKLPLQALISSTPGRIQRMRPDSQAQNIAWLLELKPNRWMTPFMFKKVLLTWLVTRGAGRVWLPMRRPGQEREMFILPTNYTTPVFKPSGLWYEVKVPGREVEYFPDSEVLSLLINSEDGINGRGVISYARETLGRQLANYATQNKISGRGLNPSGIAWMAGEVNDEARKKLRNVYETAIKESGIAIFDPKVTKFEAITMHPVDVQFLESIQQNDLDVANFFGVPLYKLNQGKQSYQSNEQQNLDYLNSTLDPYLVQIEQAARLKWLSDVEQASTYFRFERNALLRTDAKTRSEMLQARIMSGQLTPNEARQIEDLQEYEGGDGHYLPVNAALVGSDGSVGKTTAQPV